MQQRITFTTGVSLRTAWHALRAQQPIRQRDAADLLGVSEAELLASRVGDGVTRLARDLRDVLKAVPACRRAGIQAAHARIRGCSCA